MKKNKKLILLLIIPILIIVAITYAKYAHNSVWSYYLKTKGFYFSSDYLSPSTKKNTNLSWNGTDIHFSIQNYIDNSLVTTFDIPYRVTCEVLGNNNYTCNLNNTNQSTYQGTLSGNSSCLNETEDEVDVSEMSKSECELGGYIWYQEKSKRDFTFNIQAGGAEITDVQVRITAESLNKYKQRLIGIFTLHKASENTNEVSTLYEDYSNYDKVILTNKSNSKKCISFSFDPEDLRFDNSLTLKSTSTNNSGYINEFVIEVPTNECKELYFYKMNLTKTYTNSDIDIEVLDECQ